MKHNINNVRMLELPEYGDDRGNLVVAETEQDIPFSIQRVFYIYGTKGDIVRGKHANRKTQFVLINVAGKSKIRIKDGEGNEAVFSLNRPRTGVYLPPMVWKEMFDFSEDSVLLCLASAHYDAEEYIRDYDTYVEEIAKMNRSMEEQH
ncbi:FdtA/QdtA family cupin domain-containing protein [Selenomonas sp.]|uniref:sugar 3,4-ketoisomerase n=1 Tax=Selenomonas sp. TaxID=2053611 RepID=UPI002A758027|nr:FdtA/QdtA family cupin domain-containing protein [Selenomonas sp.]MDY3298604.1 FdtA/QdtA family cupin domain-containing protein [Selenomonas sp.]